MAVAVAERPDQTQLDRPERPDQAARLDQVGADLLAGRICAAASLAAESEAALIRLVGEFDAGGGVRFWSGVKSVAHWLSWACSMAPGTAREHVRVARALRRMPTIEAAFADGRLSYSKVREATRVVGLVDEEKLCEFALTATASQLARTVSGYRTASGNRIRQEPSRSLTWTEREDEMVDFRIKLPKEEAAVLIAALNAAKDQFGAPPPAPPPGGRQQEPESSTTPVYGYADAVLDVVRGFLATAPEDRSGEDRTLVVVHVSADLLRADATHEAGDVPAGTPETADRAPDPTCHVQGLGGIEAETARRLACDADVIAAVVEPDLDGGQVLAFGRTRRLVSRAQRRALMIRDGRCQFPSCHQTRHLKAHHRVSWADGGPTDLDNLILLCQWHHTAVHEGHVTISPAVEAAAGGRWRFTMPDGRVADGWDAERLAHRLADLVGRPRYLHELTDPDHLDRIDRFTHPDAQKIVPGWRGEPFLLHDCVEALCRMEVRPEYTTAA